MRDTEHSTCDFCGDPARVAVSEQGPSGKVRICASCVTWAAEQLASKPYTPDLPGPGAPLRCTEHGGIGFKSDCIVCRQVGGAEAEQATASASPCEYIVDGSQCHLEAGHRGRHEFNGPCKAGGINSSGKMRRCRLNAGHSGPHEPYE